MKGKLAFAALLSVSGCVEHQVSPTAGSVTTLNVKLLSPDPGSPGNPNTVQTAVVNIDALTDDGTNLPVDLTVDIYLSYGGVLAGAAKACGNGTTIPIETVTLKNGKLANEMLTLPAAFGRSSIWVVEKVSHVVGASEAIYFANPTIPDLQTPPDPTATNATFCSAFEKKFVTVDHATGSGELLIDSVFNGAVTVVDTGSDAYNALYLFTFGAPAPNAVKGAKLNNLSGNISKFVGFTEVNFPILGIDGSVAPDPSKLPAPVDLTNVGTSSLEKLNSLAGRTVQLTGTICPMQPANPNKDPNVQSTITQWIKYNAFVLGRVSCDSFTEFAVQLPSKVIGAFDPTQLVGKKATLRGMLKNSSGQTTLTDATGVPLACGDSTPCAAGVCVGNICKKNPFNFWTIAARDASDINPTTTP
ncbi:MAG: hypothetical protein ABI321_23315 [Polyangia bacterium]